MGSYCYGDDDTIAYDAIRIEFSEENCNVIGGEKVGDSMCNDDNDVCCRGRKLSTSDTCQIPDADGNLLTYIKYEIDYDYYEYQLASSCNSPLAVEDSDEKCIEGNTVICCFEKDAAKGLRYNQYTLNECKDFGGEKISEAGDFLVDPEDIKNNKCVEVGCLYADPVTGNMVSEVMRRGNCEDLGGSEDGGTII